MLSLTIMLNIFIDFQPEYLGRPTTGNGYTRGSDRVENLTYGYGSGRVVKTVYPRRRPIIRNACQMNKCIFFIVFD